MSSAPVPFRRPARTPVSCSVRSFDGTSIAYDLYDEGSRSAVLVIPGFWRDRRHPAMLRLAAFLNANGYRAAIVDPRGHGDSGGGYGFNLHEHYDTAGVGDEFFQRPPIASVTRIRLSSGACAHSQPSAAH